MPTLNSAATLKQAQDFASDYASATLEILDGVTVCATFTIPTWSATNSGANGVATASSITDVTIANDGNPVDSARLSSGGRTWTLSVGTSGAEVNLTTLNFISGQTASVTSASVTFPA